MGAPIGVNFSQEGPVFKCSRLRPGARPAICHPERSEGSALGPVRDPSLRSELALERSEGMTAVLKLTPMRDAPNRFNEWVVAVLSLILLFSTLTIYPG